MSGVRGRLARCVVATALALPVSGCESIFQNFSAIESPYLYKMPTNVVANQVACELQNFWQEVEKNPAQYDFTINKSDYAKVTLTLQTDNTGNVTYVGVDLNKFGLSSLGELITTKSNVPSLGIKGQVKSTVSAAIEMRVFQDRWETEAWRVKGKKCSDTIGKTLRHLALSEWLQSFFKNLKDDAIADMSSITLKTEFQFLVDISTGVNPLFATAFILPINGMTLQWSPAFTHKLEIKLMLCSSKKRKCSAPESG